MCLELTQQQCQAVLRQSVENSGGSIICEALTAVAAGRQGSCIGMQQRLAGAKDAAMGLVASGEALHEFSEVGGTPIANNGRKHFEIGIADDLFGVR